MKTTKKDFDAFKKECLRLQQKWGLNEWRLYFDWVKLNRAVFASIVGDFNGRVVTLSFNREISEEDKAEHKPKEHAKHEMIHLLSYKLFYIGGCRYLQDNELVCEWEALTVMLEKLL